MRIWLVYFAEIAFPLNFSWQLRQLDFLKAIDGFMEPSMGPQSLSRGTQDLTSCKVLCLSGRRLLHYKRYKLYWDMQIRIKQSIQLWAFMAFMMRSQSHWPTQDPPPDPPRPTVPPLQPLPEPCPTPTEPFLTPISDLFDLVFKNSKFEKQFWPFHRGYPTNRCRQVIKCDSYILCTCSSVKICLRQKKIHGTRLVPWIFFVTSRKQLFFLQKHIFLL